MDSLTAVGEKFVLRAKEMVDPSLGRQRRASIAVVSPGQVQRAQEAAAAGGGAGGPAAEPPPRDRWRGAIVKNALIRTKLTDKMLSFTDTKVRKGRLEKGKEWRNVRECVGV